MKYQVLLFYKYVTVKNPQELKEYSLDLCKKYNLTGRVIIAEEGINYTLEGVFEDTEAFVTEFLKDARFSDTHIKRSEGKGVSFPGLSIKVRKEIVGTKFPAEVDPRIKTGNHLKAEELHEWYRTNKDFVVVDMRNSYEYASGHFRGSEDLGMSASRELKEVVDKLEDVKDKTIVTVCTGGIKCEKMSAYLLHKGFKDVHQLDGGIHTYMEKYPAKDFLGTLYTYDERLTMDFGGDREIVGTCLRCKEKTEKYQNCANAECNMLFLICDECMSEEGPGFCSNLCEKSTARVVQRIRV
ncbi:rhodanese-related sulfurtransferase [Candidatus Gracilibacteria bacterium]|nr:rhodanese-related sulfurtransferase [Candidatus Gracilibacteria bacterium]MCF7898695.1 rhodanese-related sulfurtransferase [Candidatus Paceibacterota bacterium]